MQPAYFPLINSLIGALVTFGALYLTIMHNRKEGKKSANAEVVAFCRSIAAELESLNNQYRGNVGEILLKHPKGKSFPHVVPIFEDYFPIYNTSAGMVGKIKDEELRTEIIHTYTVAKSHIDTLRANNQMVEDKRSLAPLELVEKNSHDFHRHENLNRQLDDYSGVLVDSNRNFLENIARLLPKLKSFQQD